MENLFPATAVWRQRVRRLAAAGSTPEYFPSPDVIARANAIPRISTDTAGDTLGPATGESCITVPQHVLTERLGASARNLFGGTTPRMNGPATTSRTSPRPSAPIIAPPPTPK